MDTEFVGGYKCDNGDGNKDSKIGMAWACY